MTSTDPPLSHLFSILDEPLSGMDPLMRRRTVRMIRDWAQAAESLGYAAHGAAGMATLFMRGMLCNWMVSTGVVGAMVSTNVSGKVMAMWMPMSATLRALSLKVSLSVSGFP